MVAELEREMKEKIEQLRTDAFAGLALLGDRVDQVGQRIIDRVDQSEQRLIDRVDQSEQRLTERLVRVDQRIDNLESENVTLRGMIGSVESRLQSLDTRFERYLESWKGPALRAGMNVAHYLMWGAMIVVALKFAEAIGA